MRYLFGHVTRRILFLEYEDRTRSLIEAETLRKTSAICLVTLHGEYNNIIIIIIGFEPFRARCT